MANTPRTDQTPPPAVADLLAWRDGNRVGLLWTAPPDAARYHIVWSDRPIVAQNSLDPGQRNWWAASAVGPTLAPQPGMAQTLFIDTQGAETVYVALFTFDSADNMSMMSNLVLAGDTPPAPIPTPTPGLFLPWVGNQQQ